MKKDLIRKFNRRGDLAFPVVIFLILNILFFTMMMLFVQRVSSNALLYEEAYAKRIGLLLNRAESGMQFQINVTDLIKVALKNGLSAEALKSIINIDPIEGRVTVKAKPEGGFSFPYFSNIDINSTTTRLNILRDKTDPNKIVGGVYYITIE